MKTQINQLFKVDEGVWRRSDGFICRRCEQSAYVHPQTNQIWGCKKCSFTTAAISIYFKPNPESN